jgi:hypothetical protein
MLVNMPCRDERTGLDDAANYDRLQAATRAACDMQEVLGTHNLTGECQPETIAWILEHDALDRERVRSERQAIEIAAKRRAALAKLTPEERATLGIK